MGVVVSGDWSLGEFEGRERGGLLVESVRERLLDYRLILRESSIEGSEFRFQLCDSCGAVGGTRFRGCLFNLVKSE